MPTWQGPKSFVSRSQGHMEIKQKQQRYLSIFTRLFSVLLTLILKRFVGAVLSRDWEEEREGKKCANFNTDNIAAEKLQFFC